MVRTAHFSGLCYSGDFPYFNWAAPIIQKVKVPAQVSNGVFVPEHIEIVVLEPGKWKMSPAYPISSGKRRKYGAELKKYDVNVSDITTLPKQYGKGDNRNGSDGEERDCLSGMDKKD